MHSKEFHKTAFYVALCLFLSLIENAIPKPLPFLRLGIANISIILALSNLSIRNLFYLFLSKIFIQSLISGTLFSYIFVFSFSSSLSSLVIMIILSKFFSKHISYIGISLFGSLASTISQLILSYFLFFKDNTKYISFILLLSGLITGLIIGIITDYISNHSTFFSLLRNNTKINMNLNDNQFYSLPKTKFSIKYFFLPFLTFLSIVLLNLLIPSGRILLSIGSFNITQDALLSGIIRGGILFLSIILSKLFVPKQIKFSNSFSKFINLVFYFFYVLNNFHFKDIDNFNQDNISKKKRGFLSRKSLFLFLSQFDNYLVKTFISL